jgi:hypothetical protein
MTMRDKRRIPSWSHNLSPEGFISFERLERGKVYRIVSRNLVVGVFAGRGFIGIRTKFGNRFLFEEIEWTRDEHFGTARAWKELGKIENIPLSKTLGTVCGICRSPAEFDKPKDEGGRGWFHADGTELCKPLSPVAVKNRALFDRLESYEKALEE